MEQKEFYDMDDFMDEEDAFVLDSAAFNRLRHESSLLSRLEGLANSDCLYIGMLKDQFESEASYLSSLAFNIRNSEDYFTLDDIVKEIGFYYKRIGKVMECLHKRQIKISPAFPYIAGVADAMLASQIYAVPRAMQLIAGNPLRFEKYHRGILDMMREEAKPSVEEEKEFQESLNQAYDEGEFDYLLEQNAKKVRKRKMCVADSKILSLALMLAEERPTMLFTGDARHIGKAAGKICSGLVSGKFADILAGPTHQFRVYIGYEKGWKLWRQPGSS